MSRSEELFARAVKRIPGGVNSPVRAYGSVTEAPRFIQGAVGSKIFDVDGNAYICLLYTSPSPRDRQKSRMPSSA